MPGVVEPHDGLAAAVQQIVLSSDENYTDQLIPVMRDLRHSDRAAHLIQALNQVSSDREADIERMCNSNHQGFINSVNSLQRVREGTMTLTSEIMTLSQSIQASTEKLAEQKKALVDSRGVRQNIDEATLALKDCLELLRLANQVHELLGKKNHYAALRALDELQNVHLREVTRYKIAEMIEKSVPATQTLIREAVMTDLNTWLFRIRETSQFLGEVAFYHTEMRRARQKERSGKDEYLGSFKLNSAIGLVADESEEFDVLNNDEVQVDFSPLYECMHIHDALGQNDRFRTEYAATRRRQKELLLPTSLNLLDEDGSGLSSLLEGIAGFAIVERATMKKTDGLRTSVDVDELWDSMCQSAITLISSALPTVDNDEKLLKIKGVIALFVQTMDSWGYSVTSLDTLLLTLFEKYAQLLKKRFSDDFQEIVSTDDYMPMLINNLDEYDKVVNSLDELLCEKVCQSLIERLSSQYPGQIVQILTNLEHFETACKELQILLAEARSSTSAAGPIVLAATQRFEDGKKTAEKRIFELVNSKIDDLIETAEYEWMSATPTQEPSPYMVELTRYLSNIMSSVLLGLPTAVKSLIYFDALDHAARSILALPLSPHITRISPAAVAALTTDVDHLTNFVNSLGNAAVLQENLDEIRQTVELMGAENAEEFFEAGRAGRRFGKVDKMTGAVLLEKVAQGAPPPPPAPASVPAPATQAKPAGQFSTLSSRLGINK
ncbi:hypothetical protein B0A49_00027 [Cryomyces minteri]|uniref:Exocyst complex component SEC15 n=1 Tax=Cryomyces minteri TaxID=331657 RepID=A0A4U0Y241_9PEZI|nr:hypothetical protein B0A49_00027 [Cryomyces minteri]